MKNLIEIRGLKKTYKTGEVLTPILHGLDLEIKEGEFVAIMGPSGSGKSCAMAVHIMQRRQSFLWLTSNEVREITTEAAKKGGEWTMKLERMRKVAVLVIDDLSQVKFTDTFSGELYQLLEFRNKHRLAVLWTSQKDLGALRIKIAEQVYRDKYQAAPTHPNQLDTDQAFAITRRLGQDAIKLEAKP